MVDPRTGSWYTVGDTGASFENIPQGAIVFNHKQTEALFKYGKVAGRGRALASGTAMAGGSSDSSGNGRIPLSATAALDIELNVNDKDLEKKLEKELSEMSDKLEYILGQYEHKIFLIEKNAVSGMTENDAREIVSIYRKMMDEVHAQADAARAKGLSDNSKTVTELSKKWFELRDNMQEAITKYYEGLISKTQNAIKLLDFQTGELQNKFQNRTKMVTAATKEIADELKKLGKGGNVNLLKRPVIDASTLRDVGWGDAGEGKATVFSNTFSNEAGTKAINFTPIIADKNGKFIDVMEPDALERYAEEVVEGVHDDYLDLQIGAVFTGEDAIQQAERAAERVHELHEKYFLNPPKNAGPSFWEFSDDGNYDEILKNLDEVIEKQREIQRIAHEGADEQRALGISEDSDEIRKFKDDWEGAADDIVEAITTAYDAITSDLENRVTLTENWLDKAVTDADFDAVVKYSDDIYDYYTQMQNAIHEEADRLRALGYSDTSEEVSKLSDLWWDYEEKRKAMALDAWKEIVDATKDAAKEIAGVYNTLQKAADDYAKFGGYISLDSMEALLEMGPQYLRFLQDENGLWTINREAIEKVIAAKYEDLAVTNALSYVDRLRLAVEGKSNEKLDELLGITDKLTGATWDLVYAKLADIDMTEEQFNIALENIKRIQSLSQNAIGGIGMTLFGDADRYASGMSDLIKYVMDMLADRLKEQTDKLKEQAEEYSKIIDRKKESLRLTKEENDYQKDISDKMKEAAKLQEKIDLLALDDSRKGQAERIKLQEDLSKLQGEIADKQGQHMIDAQTDALDKMDEAFKEEKDEEIKKLEETASSYQKRWDQAIAYIEDHYDTLYQELIDWNYKIGDSLSTDIQKAWADAEAAVQHYGSVAEAVMASITAQNSDSGINNIVGEVTPTGTATQNKNAGLVSSVMENIKSMKANSKSYDAEGPSSIANGTQNQKDRAAENVRLASIISEQMGVSLSRNSKGEWVLPDGRKLYDISSAEIKEIIGVYHQGGRVGRGTVAENEKIAILKDKEWVLSEKMVQNLSAQMDRIKMLKNHVFGTLAPAGGPPLLDTLGGMPGSAYNNVTNNQPVTITIGDTIINGENGNALSQHKKVSEDMVNQIARMLGVRR